MLRAAARFLFGIPVVGYSARRVLDRFRPPSRTFRTSSQYWEDRYTSGGTSGAGSYNRLAHFKAEFLNAFVREHQVRSVVEFGSGDGAQLALSDYPQYIGYDVSASAVEQCRARFAGDATKDFRPAADSRAVSADLALSLDVIYHLVEDEIFDQYQKRLFDSASRYVIIYASNDERPSSAPHVRHRQFTRWVEQNRSQWKLKNVIPNAFPYDENDKDNTSFADFYVFARE